MVVWILTEQDGRFEVRWGRKQKNFPTEAMALKFINENLTRRDKAVRIEEDGYSTPITRRKWRRV